MSSKLLPMTKNIACLDMDCFFVSVERLLNPKLKNKPVIVGGDPKSRGVVSACSYETRVSGVHSGMALFQAYRLCPQAIFLTTNGSEYGRYSRLVAQFLARYIPIVIQASIDEFYLDLTGCEGIYGDISIFLTKIKRHISKKIGLPCSIGLGTNKHIAKIASNLAKPGGLLKVIPGSERELLAPLPIKYLQGVGNKTATVLLERGIKTIGKLAELPPDHAGKILGKSGTHLWLKAQGKDGSYFEQGTEERKSISKERTFSTDTNDRTYIKSQLGRLVEKVAYTLRKSGCKTQCITLKIRFADFKTKTIRKTVAATDQDQQIYQIVLDLLAKSYQGRLRLRLIGVTLSKLQKESMTSLFWPDFEGQYLYKAIDKIKNKYGQSTIHWANTV